MNQIAKVIVDVPTMQTNRAFDYQVPAVYLDLIKPGMRVIVPFGRGSRQVQGFVLEIVEQPSFQGDLKAIIAPMDLQPVLNAELLAIGSWLANQTYAFEISCLQAMLPNVMRAKYTKIVTLIDEITPQLQKTLFKDNDELIWDDKLTDQEVKQLLQLQRQQKISITYHVENKARVKQKMAIVADMTFEQLEEQRLDLRKTAKKQQALITYLQQIGTTSTLIEEVLKKTDLTRADIQKGLQKGWLKKVNVEVYRRPFEFQNQQTQPLTLNADQANAVEAILMANKKQSDTVFLLEGVTGSGKTEVYLQTIASVLNKQQTALMLVPEIALTPQMVTRFKGRFGDLVAVLHSGLSDGEKYDEWRRIQRKEAKIVVGARSAVFAPLENLGVVIMDEEHESSYKQDDNPRYHARDIALLRAKHHHCPVVLGSATPSLESRARAQKKVYQLLSLPKRINDQVMPSVEIIDMTKVHPTKDNQNFAPQLLTALKERLANNEQSVLLLNRRGFSSFVMCRSCGFVLKCPNCDISLTLHMDTHSMKCHYCGHEEAIPNICPTCHEHQIRYYGTGTQKVATELAALIPDARILRMDVDTTRKKGAHAKILKSFGDKQADILLGTQMIAKGLDFPDVTLVGVINADTALGLPDFRAGENTFQLLTQVSGRAGRAEKKGQVLVQTYNPDNYAILFAQKHDYENFFRYEMKLRHLGNYPPYFFTTMLTISHENEQKAAQKAYAVLKQIKPDLSKEAIILGPSPKSIARINNRYFYQIIIKYKYEAKLNQSLNSLLELTQSDLTKGYKIAIDANPIQFN